MRGLSKPGCVFVGSCPDITLNFQPCLPVRTSEWLVVHDHDSDSDARSNYEYIPSRCHIVEIALESVEDTVLEHKILLVITW